MTVKNKNKNKKKQTNIELQRLKIDHNSLARKQKKVMCKIFQNISCL